jgi:phosphatidylserine decarboxylase
MRIDPAGWPFVLGALVLAIIAAFAAGLPFGIGLLLLAVFFLFFFRDPDRVVSAPPLTVVSPADGRVMVAGTPTATGFPADSWEQISIFLSPMDVHVNRMPIGGRVMKVTYKPGRFLPAYKEQAADLNEFT